MLSNIIEAEGSYTDSVHRLALGTIGKTATELKNFIAYYALLPKVSDILKDPAKADLPTDVGQLYALCGVMAQAMVDSKSDASKVGKYMDYVKRMPPENQTVTVKNAIAKDRKIAMSKAIGDWCTANAALITAAL